MRAIENTRDVNARKYIEREKKAKRIKRVTEVEKKEAVTSVEHYEKRGMTEEDKERKTSITPQEAFRREIAKSHSSKIYVKLQNNHKAEENKENRAIKTEEKETER